MEIISDWIEAVSEWDEDDINQAIILLGFTVVGLFGLASLCYRIYAFFFPEKGPFPWKDGWGGEETPSEDEEVGSQPNDRSSNDSDTI
tara:strand:+ start:1269 stop:1532 length:264 start_codon:yes stop_codon:yes gene_type:complete